MKHILLVEDEDHLADGLRFNLEAEGYLVSRVSDGTAADEALRKGGFDAVVLDVMMPGADGFEVAAAMRSRGDYSPVLMLTALGRPEDVLRGFEAGADDYLAKPFDLGVLLARVSGLIRRREWTAAEAAAPERPIAAVINGRKIDLENLRLTAGDTVRDLTQMEAGLLGYLIENRGRAVSRKEILTDVWGLSEETDTRAIDNFIVRLRRYLGDDPTSPEIVETVRGKGYRLAAEKQPSDGPR
ncbi:MAG: response regulator transcription factor [Acidobacteria bacterium]|nr:response regulator transcription factor [Acidobacteriota bacterium]MCW5948379.1 response regulator transcription factor [Pyrinomonadaceae bacterium]